MEPEDISSDQQHRALAMLVEEDLDESGQIECLKALTLDRVSPELLREAVALFQARMVSVNADDGQVVDLAGTGGDGTNSFNISTTAAFITAAAGVSVVKHGNVGITSRSGGADLLRALDLVLPDTAERAENIFERHRLVFLFAPYFHPAFKRFAGARKQLAAAGTKTLFNILGPLLNPARARYSLTGVYDPALLDLMAKTKLQTGTTGGLVVHGDGMDELSLTGLNQIIEIRDGTLTAGALHAPDLGLAACTNRDLEGGTPADNARITWEILSGRLEGPKKDITLLNAAGALRAYGLEEDWQGCLEAARESLESRRALDLLKAMQA